MRVLLTGNTGEHNGLAYEEVGNKWEVESWKREMRKVNTRELGMLCKSVEV